MAKLSMKLLGPFEAALDGRPVLGFESDKARALLAYLALEGGRPHSREFLAALLWSEQPETLARGSLSQVLYNLRQILGDREALQPFLVITNKEARCDPAAGCEVDAQSFEALLDACEEHKHARPEACPDCAERMRAAASLYRGALLAELSLKGAEGFDEWLGGKREQLDARIQAALASLAAFYESRVDFGAALGWARQCVQLNPLSEDGQRILMRLLAISGQGDAARAQYTGFQRLLADTRNSQPERETQALYQRLSPEAGAVDNLPTPLTPFIGRQAETVELEALVLDRAARLVTVVGVGGSGKTRLAIQAAGSLRYHFPDGACFVALSALQSTDAFIPAVADALKFPLQKTGDPRQQVIDYLRGKYVLLVMDGFEAMLDAAGWVVDLLQYAPGVKVLATSRVHLNITGEHLYHLGGMDYPETGDEADALRYGAMQLFAAGARGTAGEYEPDPKAIRDTACICRLVQGSPLGILLASAWAGEFTPGEIAAEIEKSLDFLAAERRDLPERQHSLRATFDYSWNLLSERERTVLAALSVFQGSFVYPAAKAVVGAGGRELRSLIDKCMLQLVGAGRYLMHDLSRQYAGEKLETTPRLGLDARERFGEYYSELAQKWTAALKGEQQAAALAEMDAEITNLQAAWSWMLADDSISSASISNESISHKSTRAGDVLEGMCMFFDQRGRLQEGARVCQQALEAPLGARAGGGAVVLRARALAWQARFLRQMGQSAQAHSALQSALALLESGAADQTDLRGDLGFIRFEQAELAFLGDRPAARQLYHASLEVFRELDDRWWTASVLKALGFMMLHEGNFPESNLLLKESLDLSRALGEPRAVADTLFWMGLNQARLGDIAQGESLIQESLAIRQTIGDPVFLALGLYTLGMALLWVGRLQESMALLQSSLPVFEKLNYAHDLNYLYVLLGLANVMSGCYPEAEMYFSRALETALERGYLRNEALARMGLGGCALAYGRYDDTLKICTESIERFKQLDQPDEICWNTSFLANAAYRLGQMQRARAYVVDALRLYLEGRAPMGGYFAFIPAALLYLERGQVGRAVELYALATTNPALANGKLFEDTAGKDIRAAAQSLPAEEILAAQQRGQAGSPAAVAQALLEEL